MKLNTKEITINSRVKLKSRRNLSRVDDPNAFSRLEHNLHFTENSKNRGWSVYFDNFFIYESKKVKTFKIYFALSKVQIIFWSQEGMWVFTPT